MIRGFFGGLLVSLALTGHAMADPTYTRLTFDDLDGWAADDHQAALDVFQNTGKDCHESWKGMSRTSFSNGDSPKQFGLSMPDNF